MVIVRGLYWLKSSGVAWITMSVETLHDMTSVPTVDDPDVYCRQASKINGED